MFFPPDYGVNYGLLVTISSLLKLCADKLIFRLF